MPRSASSSTHRYLYIYIYMHFFLAYISEGALALVMGTHIYTSPLVKGPLQRRSFYSTPVSGSTLHSSPLSPKDAI